LPSSSPSVDFESRFGFVPDPPVGDQDARFGFVPDNAKPSTDSRFGFVEESPAELHRRIWSFKETPTDYEIGRLIDSEAERKGKQSWLDRGAEFANQVIEGGKALVETEVKGVKRPFESGANVGVGDFVQSVAEGFTQQTAALGNQLVNALTSESEWVEDKSGKWRRMTDAEKRDRTITSFRRDWEEKKQEALKKPGESNILPEVFGKADPVIVDAARILDPTLLLGGAAGVEAKGASLLRRSLAMAAEKAGGTLESASGKAMAGVKGLRGIPTRIAEGVAAPGTEEAAQLAAAIDRYGTIGAVGGAGLLGVTSPATFTTLAGAAAAIPMAQVAGQGLSAVGRNLLKGTYSEQLGLLGNIARDRQASGFVRGAARLGQFADPALSLAGRTAEGALHGGAASGLITASLGGSEDEVAQSIGGGGIVGGGARAIAGALPSARRAAVKADLVRWMNEIPPEAQAAMASSGLTTDQAARVMNAQRFISGVGDVDFHYLTAEQWKAAGLAPGRALETTPGDRPQVYVNATEIGNGAPVLHEIGHVLHRLFPEEAADLHRTLFSDFQPAGGQGTDFTTGRTDTSRGILSPEQQQKLYDSYFTKLDPKTQAERRATWNQADHLRSAREEIVGELLSDLLTGKRPDYLHNLGGPLRRIADKLELSVTGSFLGKLPVLDRLGERTQPGGSSLLTLDGEPLQLTRKEAAALRGLLRVRDRTTREVRVGEEARPVGTVTEAEMRGKHHEIISKLYGNSDTYAKNVDGSLRLAPDGRPVLLTEAEVRKLQADRYGSIAKALGQSPQGSDTLVVNGREIKPVRLLENGRSWEGHYFSDAQLNEIRRSVPGNLITPEQFNNIRRLNDAIKTGQGTRLGVDHNTATKEVRGSGRRVYTSQGSKFYELVPYGFGVNKEGGLYFRAFDAGNLDRKLGRWMEGKGIRDQFAVWGNDRRAVEADIYKYLDNQRNGVLNSRGLDDDPVRAIQKRNIISDLLGATRGSPEVNPSQLSKKGRDDNFKTFRVDRVNKLTESGGKNLPVDYYKAKQNLMPDSPNDPSRHPVEIAGQDGQSRVRFRILAPPGESPQIGTLSSEMLKGSNLPAGSILVQRGEQVIHPDGELGPGWGWEHIVSRHAAEIIDEGYPSVWDFIKTATTQFDEVWKLSGNREDTLELVTRVGPNKRVSVRLRPTWNDYTVRRAHMIDEKTKIRGKLLWKKDRSSPSSGTGPASSLYTTRSAIPHSQNAQGEGGTGLGYTTAPESLPQQGEQGNPLPPGVTPSAVIRHVQAQAREDMRTNFISGGAPPALAQELAVLAWKRAERLVRREGPAPHERAYAARAAERLKSLEPADYEAIKAATLKGGMKGAAREIETRLLVATMGGQRVGVRVN